ncbi:hypothetical protein DACRYDRAFT_106253 [Dacryopinax primogenitus]|uniref:Amino acid transporter transmembrane domain-containing protein n=1 Tax=Dacryopinax primogenitus (strain DJM 731) TaxID=1858805 RepID=M5GE88_DACPD|nr:uncharacterized protein DACRYDRAFT_106253 [Dacryopinax primogenitus]EJU03078.1 hypothetical protein DACRYDRAFT_106253 [Dacryopinax primogenitus]
MAALPTGTPNASTASLTLYPPSSPQEESFTFGPEDGYDLVSPSDLEAPEVEHKERAPPPQLPAWLCVPAMLTPSLSLGALLLPHTLESFPILLGAGLLLLAIVIAAGVQSIWRGAGRYVRRDTVEERVAEAVCGSGRGIRREKWKKLVSGLIRMGMLSTGLGLCVVYLRSAVQLLVPHISPHIDSSAVSPLLGLGFSFLLIPFVCIQQPLRYLPLLHIAAYIAFLICSLVSLFGSRSEGVAAASAEVLTPTFSTIFHQPRAALTVNTFFQSIATLLILPIMLAPPSFPAVRPIIPALSACLGPVLLLPLVLLPSTYPAPASLPTVLLSSLLLFLSSIRVSRSVIRPRSPGIKLSVLLWALGSALTSFPEAWGTSALVWDFTLSSLLYFGYVLPSLVHLILHHLRSPLSILFPTSAPLDGAHDALLLKKERSMQLKRETKRVLQDLLLFGVLLPGGLTVWGWSLGRFVRIW